MITGNPPINQDIVIRVKFILDELNKGVQKIEQDVQSINQNINELVKQTKTAWDIFFGNLEKGYKSFRTTAKNFADLLRAEFRWILGFEIIRGIENAIRFAINSMVELDYALAKVRAATLATDNEMKVLHQTILKISQTVPYTFTELGEALAVIVRAGVSIKDAGKFLETASKLALITGEDLKKVAEFLVSVQKVYQFSTEQLPNVANLLAVALNKSKLALKDVIIAWQYVAPTAKTINMSMEELLATMMVLSDKGLEASKIGTNLRQVITYLAAPTTKLARIFEQFGLSLDDVNVFSRNFIQVLDLLKEKGFGVEEAFKGLGIRGATAFAYLLTSIDDIKQALAELASANIINILEQATGYMRDTLRGTFQILRNELAVTSVAFLDLIKPATIDTVRGFIQVLHVLQTTMQALNTIISSQISTAGMFATGIALLSRNFLHLGTSASTLVVVLTGLAAISSNLVAKSLGLREGFITTADAVMVLVMAITALRARTSELMRILLIIEGIMFGLQKLGNLIRQFSGAGFVQSVGDFTFTISELFKAKNIDEFRMSFEKLRSIWKDLPEDIKESSSAFKNLFANTKNVYEAYQYFIRNQQTLSKELKILPQLIDKEIEREKALLEQRKKQLQELQELPAYFPLLPTTKGEKPEKIIQEIQALENRIKTLTTLKENLQIFIGAITTVGDKTDTSMKKGIKSLSEYQKFLSGVIQDASRIETPIEKVKEGFSTLFLRTLEILRKHGIEVSQTLITSTMNAINQAGGLKQAQMAYINFLQEINKTGKLTGDILQQLSKETIKVLASPEMSKALQSMTKETERLASKKQQLAETVAMLRQELQSLFETEPYGIEYFERLFRIVKKFEDLKLKEEALNLKQTVIGRLIEYLRSEEVMLAPKELMRLYRLLSEIKVELPYTKEQIFGVARESFRRYIQTMVSGIEGVINTLNLLLKEKNVLDVILGPPERVKEEAQNIVNDLLEVIKNVWTEGGIGLKQMIALKDKFAKLGELYGIDFSKAFVDTITSTITLSLDTFFKNLETLIKIYGRESDIVSKFIKQNIERLVSVATIGEAKRSFQFIVDFFEKFKEFGIPVEEVINKLIERTKELYETNKTTTPQIVELWSDWLRVIRESGKDFSTLRENLELLGVSTLNESFRQGKIDIEEYSKRLQTLLQLTGREPNVKVIMNFLRQVGPVLADTIAQLREQLQTTGLTEEQLKTLEQYEQTMTTWLNMAVQSAKEGKMSFEELFSILRQYGQEGYMYIEQITSSMSKQEMVIYALKDAFVKLRLDTKTEIEYMSDAFLAMSQRLRDAFTNTFVKVMKGEIKNLGDIWRQFLIDMVSIWQEALAKMAVAKLIQWLAPQVMTGGGMFGQILGGLLGIRFQYGGVAPKTPTIGILERGERVLTPEQNRIFEQMLLEMAKNRNQPSQPQEIKIVNVVDPHSLSEFLMTSKGQEIVLNVIAANRNKVFKILNTRR